jgi:hypothetical protein
MADGESRELELNKLAKIVYSKKRPEKLVQEDARTYPKLMKSAEKLGGAGVYGGSIYQGNEAGQGSQNEYEALRTPEKQEVVQWNVQPTVFTHTIMLSGLAMDMLEGNEESFANSFTLQMDQGLRDGGKELNAQCFRTGSGRLAKVNGVVSGSQSVYVDTGIITHFRPGMRLDAYLSGTTTLEVANLKVTAIDYANSLLTVAANGGAGTTTSLTDNDDLYRSAVLTNAPTNGKELSGFPRITDTGASFSTYEGIARTGGSLVWAWLGLQQDASNANLSDDFLQRMYMTMYTYTGKFPNKMIINTTQTRKYLALTLPSVRYEGGENRNTAAADENGRWRNLEMTIDPDCGFDEVYMYRSDFIYKFERRPLNFDSTDGKIIKWNPGFDAFIAYAKAYTQIGTDFAKAMIRGYNLAYTF